MLPNHYNKALCQSKAFTFMLSLNNGVFRPERLLTAKLMTILLRLRLMVL